MTGAPAAATPCSEEDDTFLPAPCKEDDDGRSPKASEREKLEDTEVAPKVDDPRLSAGSKGEVGTVNIYGGFDDDADADTDDDNDDDEAEEIEEECNLLLLLLKLPG